MPTYVFSLGIIPVQEFIAEARRSRDLRTGSAILSFITASVLKELKADLVIPHPDALKSLKVNKGIFAFIANPGYSIPNRASGYLDAENDEDLKQKFRDAENKCIDQFWKKLFENKEIKNELDKYFNNGAFHKEAPFQLIWVARQVEGDYQTRKDNGQLQTDMEQIGKFFDDAKNTRPIKPWLYGAPIGKCTQCGKREAISPEKVKNNFQEWWKWYQEVSKKPEIELGLKFEESERLCEVCAVKRLLGYVKEAEKFPSTNYVAIKHWFSILSQQWNNSLKTNFDSLINLMEQILEDPILVFYKRNRMEVIKKLSEKLSGVNKKNLKNKLKEICDDATNFIKNRNLPIAPEPPNSLAIIIYDGDDMGKKITAHLGKDINGKEITKELYNFQKEVNDLIDKNYAQAYYTGGDEGLILCPIETTLKLALEINDLFSKHFKDIDPQMTLSMGIIFFDRERPMGTAIKQAQELLEIAKSLEEKNALTVGVQTASGNQWHFAAHWGEDWERIEILLDKITNRTISRAFIYEIENFLRQFNDEDLQDNELIKVIIKEMERIIYRKIDLKNELKEKNKFKVFWIDKLKAENWIDFQVIQNELKNWMNQFHLIGFLSHTCPK